MKPNFRKIAFILMAITAKKSSAQSSFDMSGLIPQSRIVRRGNAYGFDFGIFGEPLNFSGKKRAHDLSVKKGSGANLRPQLRLGGDYFFSELGQVKVPDVPLLAPAKGNSAVTVHDRLWGCNVALRLSLPYSAKVVPYADVFGGFSDFSTSLSIQPYDRTKNTSTQKPYDFASFNYGAAAGVMLPLGKSCKLNLGVVYSSFINQGKMVNSDSAHLESGSITMDRIDAPQSSLMFKVGLTCCFSAAASGGSSYGSGYHHYHSSCHSHIGGGHCGGGHVSVHVR